MATANSVNEKSVKMIVGGSEVLISFAAKPNPAVAKHVRKALLDSYLQKSAKC